MVRRVCRRHGDHPISLPNQAAPRRHPARGAVGTSGLIQARVPKVHSTVRLPQEILSTFGKDGAKRMARHMIAVLMNNGADVVTIVATVVHSSTGIRGLADGTRNEYYVEWMLSLRLGIIDPPGATATSGSDTALM